MARDAAAGSTPWTAVPDGVVVQLRLSPRGARDAVEGIVRDADGRPALSVRLTAPPVDGAANAALTAFLARLLDLRKADIVLLSGGKARHKRLALRGDPARLMARLETLAQGVSV